MRVRNFARRDTLLLFFLLPLLAHCFGHVCVCVFPSSHNDDHVSKRATKSLSNNQKKPSNGPSYPRFRRGTANKCTVCVGLYGGTGTKNCVAVHAVSNLRADQHGILVNGKN